MTWRDVLALGKNAARKWSEHNAPRLSASLAYYTLLSLAPVMVLLILICGVVFRGGTAEQHLLDQVRDLAGQEWVDTLRTLIHDTQPTKSGVMASIVAIIFLFVGASGVFMELRDSLNTIWEAPVTKTGFSDFVRRRLASFVAVLVFGALIITSTLLGIALHVVETTFTGFLPTGAALVGEIANVALSFVATTALFGLVFKFVPDVPIEWRDVGVGAVVTAALFAIGHTLLGLYLTKAAVGSAYGAAGSLVAFVAWVYYCAQIFFFGAVLTRTYAVSFGSKASARPPLERRT